MRAHPTKTKKTTTNVLRTSVKLPAVDLVVQWAIDKSQLTRWLYTPHPPTRANVHHRHWSPGVELHLLCFERKNWKWREGGVVMGEWGQSSGRLHPTTLHHSSIQKLPPPWHYRFLCHPDHSLLTRQSGCSVEVTPPLVHSGRFYQLRHLMCCCQLGGGGFFFWGVCALRSFFAWA